MNFKSNFYELDLKANPTDKINLKWFCGVCREDFVSNGPKLKSGPKCNNDFVINGAVFSSKSILHDRMKLHLKSKHHLDSVKQRQQITVSSSNILRGSYKKEMAANATINVLRLTLFESRYQLSSRMHTALATLGTLACEQFFGIGSGINIYGNRHHSKMAKIRIQRNIYETSLKLIALRNNCVRSVTNLSPRFMFALDCGTITSDRRRQCIVSTHLNNQGNLEETFISCGSCEDGTAAGAAQHFKTSVSKFLDLKSIVVLCTDGASYYTGIRTGMFVQLEDDPQFNAKMITLDDWAHRSELLMDHTKQSWVKAD